MFLHLQWTLLYGLSNRNASMSRQIDKRKVGLFVYLDKPFSFHGHFPGFELDQIFGCAARRIISKRAPPDMFDYFKQMCLVLINI